MPVELWLAYLVLSFLFAVTPGPAVLLTAGQAIARGFWAGFAVVLGTQRRQPRLFRPVGRRPGRDPGRLGNRLPGGQICRRRLSDLARHPHHPQRRQGDCDPEDPERVTVWRHPFTQGLINQLANPKSILFWGALFPQFVDYRADNLVDPVRRPRRNRHRRRHHRPVDLCGGGRRAAAAFLAAGRKAVWRERISGAALILVGGALSLVNRTA